MRKIKILDTTLRDGEQSPGVSFCKFEKLRIAQKLIDLGVDIIEVGFPASSPEEFEVAREISRQIAPKSHAIITALARCTDSDIDKCWKAIEEAPKKRLHLFLATSDNHLSDKLNLTKEQALSKTREAVQYAKRTCHDIQFSAEDATRSQRSFLLDIVNAAIEAGATTINIPDTVGYATPGEYGNLIHYLKINCTALNTDLVKLSVHTHNDLGLATANALSGVYHGASQIECTINGIGERAGNCALEEVVMALDTRKDYYKCDTDINTVEILPSSKVVSDYCKIPVPPNKAIVGSNAFKHESGIHQHGYLKNPQLYEIIDPVRVGHIGSHIVLGKHSGKSGLRWKMKELGFELSHSELDWLMTEHKNQFNGSEHPDEPTLLNILFERMKLKDISTTRGKT